ncbi:putative glucan 1,3-beta-glucosidase D [Lasiodiplodia theobromae]|uniref:glucan 1,3-beta-glucosidase n=1 Tax=Lasiodiplodia theobromae TaxID=45133 RepID=A0A5N5DSM5_9PEZI|nr:putative glucan 1,3-beta-glucosidase D [Lasiodiplodia theobromae]
MPRDYHYESPRERDYSRDRQDGEGYRSERERERRRQRRESRGDTDDEERRRRRRERAARHAAAAAAPGEHTPSSDREHYERAQQERQERRRRRGHRATDSTGEPILRQPERSYDSPYRTGGDGSPSPTKARQQRRPRRDSSGHRASGGGGGGWDTPASRDSGASARPLLHADALAQLDASNAKSGWKAHRYDEAYVKRVRDQEKNLEKERQREERREKRRAKEEAAAAAAAEKEREKRRRHEEEMGFRRSRHVDAELEDDDEEEEVPRHYPSGNDGIRVRGYDEYPEPYTDDPYTDDAAEPRRRRREYTDDERDERRQRRKERALAATAIAGKQRKSRVVSGPLLEEGGKEDYEYRMAANRGGGGTKDEFYDEELKKKKRKKIFIGIAIVVLLLAIIIPVAVVVSGKKSSDSGGDTSSSSSSSDSSKPDNSNLNSISEDDIPDWAKGGLLDPFSWYDTEDFNVTFTNDTVGGLSIMGLNMTWDDSVQANEHVPALDKEFKYGEMSIRGVNVGGWFNLEPWITPSFFESYNTRDGVIDEWTLTKSMGSTKAKSNLEQHYSSWITKQSFADIRDAGFDHVRIPFNYWAVTTYDGDPYVPKVSWRYLLRGIEYARQQGLRVNLDLHGLPGSQNGWNHSGKQGVIGWLNGTDGDLNRQRSLDIHDQLSKFFAQPRYKNVVTMYGLANEPRMVELDTDAVIQWYDDVIPLVRNNNITAILVFGDGFMGLDNWQGKLQDYEDLLLDVHQYVIFNVDLIKFSHAEKVNYACKGWTQQSLRSMNKKTGFGPTMCGEWSQADTDCTQYINNVGWGTRWEGTYNTGDTGTSVLTPTCPTDNNPICSCNNANADPSDYSDTYKQFLLHFALAQIYSFEQAWGWFYWTWKTEKAVQWSWESGMKAGILPEKVWDRSAFSCNTSDIPDYSGLGLAENY